LNPEVDSLTGMFEIGAIRRLNFGPAWGTAITLTGLRFISLTELYESWVRFLYAVVEMENALLNDYSIRTEQVTYNEGRGAPQPSLYRSQLLLQTHERFLRDYVSKSTGPALDHLWAITSGLCSNHHDARWARQQIASIELSASAHTTRTLGPDAQARLSATAASDSHELAHFERLTDLLAEEDRRFLNEMKLALRRGVQIFETHEHHTITQGRQSLLEVAEHLPQVLNQYYERVAGRL
jgi:hypothetical protein